MASERAAALADDFGAANAEAVAFARSCGEEAWGRPVPGEGWTVGVVVHHIAEGHGQGERWLGQMARGDGVPDTAEDVDRANAAHAVRAAAIGPAETVVLLVDGGARLETLLRALSDEELDRRAPFGPAGGRAFATVDLAAVPGRHTREHLAHARAAATGRA
jgi:Mycothiol maleylpyruvate isomerase N-terminal domain